MDGVKHGHEAKAMSYEYRDESVAFNSSLVLWSQKVRRRGLLVMSRKRATLLQVKSCELQEGQSKALSFEVGPYSRCDRGRDIKPRLEALDTDDTASDSCSAAGLEAVCVCVCVVCIY